MPASSTTPPSRSARARRRVLGVTLGIVAAAVVVAGCLPPPPPPPAELAPMTVGVTHAVATSQVTFVDWSRPTPAFGGFPGSSSRQIPTTISSPSDGGGPFPLVVFIPGYGATYGTYATLLNRIAAAGYVVATPSYPLLSGQPAGPTDTVGWEDLPGDTWFVTSEVLQLSAGGGAGIGGLIDPNRIAVAGHSDGAAIAFNDGYTPFKLDPRVRAVVSFSAGLQYYGWYQPNGRPILHVLSDNDVYNPYGEAISWDRDYLQQPKTVVTLWNATHEGPYVDPGDAHFTLVANITIGWLDTVLKAHPEQLLYASFAVGAQPNLAAME